MRAQTLFFIFGWVVLTHVQAIAEHLKVVQVIFRHGHRNPDYGERSLYPSDPYSNETWYPDGWGALTSEGKNSAYQLGRYFRERYGAWLGSNYVKENVKFRSSIFDRTIMSTQLVAAGLFPPGKLQRWNQELNWQPIPVYSDSRNTDNLFLSHVNCKRHMAMRRELEETDPHLTKRAKEVAEFFEYVGENAGAMVGQQECSLLYHQLFAEVSKDLELPAWTTGIFPEEFERVAAYDYVMNSYNTSMIQLTGGLWIREWLKNVDDYLNGTRREDPRAFFYGGHERNVGELVVALGYSNLHVPFYSSSVIFELFESQGEFYVRIFYRNKGILQDLLVHRCGVSSCPLATFRRLLADLVVEDMEATCRYP